MYEEGIRLPLIMRYQKLRRSSAENSNLVGLIDIFPTICEAAGIAVPDSVEGKSLLDLYHRGVRWDREHIFASFVSPTRHQLNIRCIRTERHKLVHHLTTDEIELYDLEKDPYELENLAGRKSFTKLQRQLMTQLSVWRTKVESEVGRL